MPAFMPFLVTGLRSFQAQSLCIVSVGVVVDICTAIGGQIQPFCDQIMSATTECLRDGSVHRDIKPIVISCFGDIAMAIGAAYEPYLSLSTMLLMQASSQRPPDNDDDELIVFINSLRLSILEAYSGIILGLSDGNALHLFSPNLPNILQFLQYLSLAESQKDEDVLLKAVALVGDIGQQMGSLPNVKQQIQQQFAVDLIQEAGRCGDPAGQDIAGWTQGVLQALN
jgi:importin subunit beta-1